MDNSPCTVLYLDRRAATTGLVSRQAPHDQEEAEPVHGDEDVSHNIETLIAAFGEVYICSDGVSCISKVAQLDESNTTGPIVLLLDMPDDEEADARKRSLDAGALSPTSPRLLTVEKNEPSDLYGIHLLLYLASEFQQRARSRLVIPVAVLRHKINLISETMHVSRFLDAGAVDVLTVPLTIDRVQGLAVHVHRRLKEASREDSSFALAKRNRKRSWVGIDEERPYAYLREVMVSGLMDGICNPDSASESVDPRSDLHLEPAVMRAVEVAVGTWSFSAHDFDADALLYGALIILEHALSIPELEKWKMSTDDLTTFLMACRRAYNDFVLYHNFRHIVDVLQAVFFFLLQIGVLPPYTPKGSSESGSATDSSKLSPTSGPTSTSPIASLLKPFDALTLLISAIGHDVGHPGVNNAFLVALNAPLAQLYNDRSVLEAFHCAAYSQILRRYWPEAFSDTSMRKLMINSILATDMGLHFKYMADMGNLQERVNASPIDGWSPKATEETRDLCCGLLIKCADISNVARKYDTAAQWAAILTDEFSNQGAMEQELNLPTCLFGGPPERGDVIKMAESQIGFMNIFARPLFEAITNVLPAMEFGVKEMHENQKVWEGKIVREKNKRGVTVGRLPGGEVMGQSSKTLGTVGGNDDLEQEPEELPPLPVERDSLLNPPRSSPAADELSRPWSEGGPRSHYESVTAAERRLRNSSMGSLSPARGPRKPSSSSSFQGPYTLPYAHHHSISRRSSKDAALETLEQMQFSGFSRVENQNFDPGRRGSADASLTTILVRSQTPQSKQEAEPASGVPESAKGHVRQSSQPSRAGGGSLPSSRSNATSNTFATAMTTMSQPSSTQASSLNEPDFNLETGNSSVSPFHGTFFGTGLEAHSSEQRHTLSAPDIHAVPEMQYSKTNLVAQMARGGSEEGDEAGRNGRNRSVRQSRSRSRLRGLKFWRKRWKSPGGVEVEGNE